MGLRLAPEKTRVVHIDHGFDFLGFNIRRMRKRGSNKWFVYTKPSAKAIATVKGRVKVMTYRSTLHREPGYLIEYLGRVLRGWANYFRHGVSKAVFAGIDSYAWERITATGCGRSTGSGGQNSGAGSACPGPGGSPSTESDSRARPASLLSGTATAATRSRPRGHRQVKPPEQQPPRGEPGAVRIARRVRRAVRGNGLGAIRAPRPGPTQLAATPGAATSTSP